MFSSGSGYDQHSELVLRLGLRLPELRLWLQLRLRLRGPASPLLSGVPEAWPEAWLEATAVEALDSVSRDEPFRSKPPSLDEDVGLRLRVLTPGGCSRHPSIGALWPMGAAAGAKSTSLAAGAAMPTTALLVSTS